jgi:hypothetical protein
MLRIFVGSKTDVLYEADPERWMAWANNYGAIQSSKLDGKELPDIYVMRWSEDNFKTMMCQTHQ